MSRKIEINKSQKFSKISKSLNEIPFLSLSDKIGFLIGHLIFKFLSFHKIPTS